MFDTVTTRILILKRVHRDTESKRGPGLRLAKLLYLLTVLQSAASVRSGSMDSPAHKGYRPGFPRIMTVRVCVCVCVL